MRQVKGKKHEIGKKTDADESVGFFFVVVVAWYMPVVFLAVYIFSFLFRSSFSFVYIKEKRRSGGRPLCF